MKRLTALLIALIIMLCTVPASASNHGVAGKYYSTDIRTYLNGMEIDAININGQTLISAEDMEYYSFEVHWYEKERLLDVYRTQDETSGPPPAVKHRAQKPGKVLGNYYYTDIVTQLDGKPITAYNIGGRTYMHAEQMRDWGYIVDWNESARTLTITSPDTAASGSQVADYSLLLLRGSRPDTDTKCDDGMGAFAVSYENGKWTGCGDASLFDLSLQWHDITVCTVQMSFHQDEGLQYSRKLQDLLGKMCSLGYLVDGEYIIQPPEVRFPLMYESLTFSINGYEAERFSSVEEEVGTGYIAFLLDTSGIPPVEQDKIESFYFSVGDTTGMEMYEMISPQFVKDSN